MISTSSIRLVILRKLDLISSFCDITICFQEGARSQNEVARILLENIEQHTVSEPVSAATVSRRLQNAENLLRSLAVVGSDERLFESTRRGNPRTPTPLAFQLIDEIQSQLVELQIQTFEELQNRRLRFKALVRRLYKR